MNVVIEYKINERDEIIFTGDGWDSFALENDAPDVTSDKVLNRSLWDFISDETTRQLYRDFIELARSGRIMQFKFKCDSPGKIRFMEMTMSLEDSMNVQFQSRAVTIDERLSQAILDRKARRKNELITICSWCKAIEVSENDWQSLEEGVSILGLLEESRLPQLSHGMCHPCYKEMSEHVFRRKLSV